MHSSSHICAYAYMYTCYRYAIKKIAQSIYLYSYILSLSVSSGNMDVP